MKTIILSSILMFAFLMNTYSQKVNYTITSRVKHVYSQNGHSFSDKKLMFILRNTQNIGVKQQLNRYYTVNTIAYSTCGVGAVIAIVGIAGLASSANYTSTTHKVDDSESTY